jgi:hypothetical protein
MRRLMRQPFEITKFTVEDHRWDILKKWVKGTV